MSDSSNLFTTPVIAAIGFGALAIYYLWKSSSADDSENAEPMPEPEKLKRLPVGKLTVDELAEHFGKDKSRILVSVCGRIFDLTKSRDFYGHPDGPYNCFTGADASYMLGAMSLEREGRNKKDFEQDGDHQITLSDWISRFRGKYPIVGRLEGYESVCPESWREAGNDDVIDAALDINSIYDHELKVVSASDVAETEKYNVDDCWLSVCGIVFDVRSAGTVYEGVYGDFPKAVGHDISVALATDTFNAETYDQPVSALKEDKQKLAKLKKMLSRFLETYPAVAFLGKQGGIFRLDNLDSISEEWDMVSQNELH